MAVLESNFTLKLYRIGEPKVYLGDNVGKLLYGDRSFAWTMRSDSYAKEVIKNMKKRLKEDGLDYNKKLSNIKYSPNNPFSPVDYGPELDTSMECN